MESLVELLARYVRHGVEERFKSVIHGKMFSPDDVQAGREFVKAYVEFVHYVERIHQASAASGHGHFPEAAEAETHETHP